MALFQRKPTVVEANQYFHPAVACFGVSTDENGKAYVTTIHKQRVYLEPGDWVLRESDGIHFYPVKPDIFAATYEIVLI